MAADTTSTTTRGRPAVVMDALGHKRTGAATEGVPHQFEGRGKTSPMLKRKPRRRKRLLRRP
ncbi:hypothetical protein PC116_g23314 [Phytophthora cactorum]|uniref:Uncharacterized protein n=1 Tax=Phytophthora cactorum TaxID=29920 RepID=A0A8T1JV38_9STRA|nr:hypothetical protein Pcac1_g5866 [Phytophthora cactorum]KAG2882435.1 hypothetical protein PC114_g21048 [Phytophthora cactorum]KAG2905155.1 hypothetical protein PC117_g20814 [Phytophthora cactorum]KAG2984221.1 hypothetical protein PC119_g20446 [Phytophthora cactorum]KAG4228323.1 hypothetical protein PC116_g23314 [Phytophthora cactorum]